MTDTTYNGWANRATWNVALWLGNDEGMYKDAIRFANRSFGISAGHDEEAAERFCRDTFGDMTPDGDKLDDVDWAEIAADMREMAGIEEDKDDEDDANELDSIATQVEEGTP